MLKVLAKSLKPLFHLGSLTFIVTLFFAILGIQLFKGQLHGGCYANYTIPSGDMSVKRRLFWVVCKIIILTFFCYTIVLLRLNDHFA